MLLGATGVLMQREPGLEPPGDARRQRTVIRTEPIPSSEVGKAEGAAEMTPSPTPTASITPSPVVGTRSEGEPEHAPAVAPRRARAATAAARTFLADYLPYSYGLSDAGRIRAAARRLLRELEASPPRVPATVGGARPRLISVRAEAATGDLGVDVLAVVDDGQRRYSIPLAVRNSGRRWIVTAVSG